MAADEATAAAEAQEPSAGACDHASGQAWQLLPVDEAGCVHGQQHHHHQQQPQQQQQQQDCSSAGMQHAAQDVAPAALDVCRSPVRHKVHAITNAARVDGSSSQEDALVHGHMWRPWDAGRWRV